LAWEIREQMRRHLIKASLIYHQEDASVIFKGMEKNLLKTWSLEVRDFKFGWRKFS